MTRPIVPITVSLLASIASVEGFVTSPNSADVAVTTVSHANAALVPGSRKTSTTELYFGIPTLGKKDEDEEEEEPDPNLEKPKIGLEGLFQLITAGAGAPFLGDYQGVDKETGKFMFSLEANNLVDEEGLSKQTSMPYFESGWVDPKDLEKEEQKKKEKAKKGNGFKFW